MLCHLALIPANFITDHLLHAARGVVRPCAQQHSDFIAWIHLFATGSSPSDMQHQQQHQQQRQRRANPPHQPNSGHQHTHDTHRGTKQSHSPSTSFLNWSSSTTPYDHPCRGHQSLPALSPRWPILLPLVLELIFLQLLFAATLAAAETIPPMPPGPLLAAGSTPAKLLVDQPDSYQATVVVDPKGRRMSQILGVSVEWDRVGDYASERWMRVFSHLGPSPMIRVGGYSAELLRQVSGRVVGGAGGRRVRQLVAGLCEWGLGTRLRRQFSGWDKWAGVWWRWDWGCGLLQQAWGGQGHMYMYLEHS